MLKNKKYFLILILMTFLLTLTSCINIQINDGKDKIDNDILDEEINDGNSSIEVKEDGEYLDVDNVSAYIYKYDKLPKNYLTKKEAKELGWIPKEGNLWDVAPNSAIGGDRFGNREGILPKKDSRVYYECDVNYSGGHRGPERLVFSNDGLVYYTEDHYKTFIKIYGDE